MFLHLGSSGSTEVIGIMAVEIRLRVAAFGDGDVVVVESPICAAVAVNAVLALVQSLKTICLREPGISR